jgi:hypothetical protein
MPVASLNPVAPNSSSATPLSGLPTVDARLLIDPQSYHANYNRTPFGFNHNLHELELFQEDSLKALVERYSNAGSGYFVAGSAADPGREFFDVPSIPLSPKHALEQLNERPTRILLKRLEQYDERFQVLLDRLIADLRALPGGLGDRPIRRIQSSLFISSASATTPLHFDPEVAFFTQIEGDKTYHVYPPDDISEEQLENFYARAQNSIGQLSLAERDPKKEQVYQLKAGSGFHQPQNSPHWVQTCETRSISYSLVFETDADKALARTRAFNSYERKLGAKPLLPGNNRQLDGIKAKMMLPNRVVRRVLDRLHR